MERRLGAVCAVLVGIFMLVLLFPAFQNKVYSGEDFGGLSIVRPGTCGIWRSGFYRSRPYAVLVPVRLNGER